MVQELRKGSYNSKDLRNTKKKVACNSRGYLQGAVKKGGWVRKKKTTQYLWVFGNNYEVKGMK